MKPLKDILEEQDNKLTIPQIAFFFGCTGTSCANHNFGSYKCEIGNCLQLRDAMKKYGYYKEKENGTCNEK